jgi:hypothetical protein
MKLGISYNLFDGEELLVFSIKTVRKQAIHINVVYQTISNFNEPADPGLVAFLSRLKEEGFIDLLILYKPDLKRSAQWNETCKREIGLRAARKAGCTHFLNMDTDEFYETEKFEKCMAYIDENRIGCSAAGIVSYIKKPVYRIAGTRQAYVPFICKIGFFSFIRQDAYFPVTVDPTRRFSGRCKFHLFDSGEIVMHHMGLVRKDLEKKFRNSTANTSNSSGLEQLRRHTLSWEYGQEFSYNDVSQQFKVEKVENIFGIEI